MLRSVFNYLRWGYTRQKAVSCCEELLASLVEWEGKELPLGIDNSTIVRAYTKSLGCIYPDLTFAMEPRSRRRCRTRRLRKRAIVCT